MTKQEFILAMELLSSNYEKYSKIKDNKIMLNIYFDILGDITLKEFEEILKIHLQRSDFPINPKNIRDIKFEIDYPDTKTAGEAWDHIVRLIRNIGVYNPEYAYSEMDEITRKTAKSLGWYNICTDENFTATRSNFLKIYQQNLDSFMHDKKLSESSKQNFKQLKETSAKNYLENLNLKPKKIKD